MSIILRALKKIQEQEAGHGGDSHSGGMPSSDRGARGASSAPASSGARSASSRAGRKRPSQAHPAAVLAMPGHSFGPGLKMLLGLLIVLGIATAGWFANSYLSLRQGAEVAKKPVPVVDGEAALPAETVTQLPATTEPEAPEPVPVPAPAVIAEPVAATPEPPVAAPVPAPPAASISPAQPGPPPELPVSQAERQLTPAQPVPAQPPIVIEVPPVEAPERREVQPAMKEAGTAKAGRPEFKINAIAWKNEEPRAIVNMQRVYEGDVIEGAKVIAIKRKIVVFEYEGEIFEVRF